MKKLAGCAMTASCPAVYLDGDDLVNRIRLGDDGDVFVAKANPPETERHWEWGLDLHILVDRHDDLHAEVAAETRSRAFRFRRSPNVGTSRRGYGRIAQRSGRDIEALASCRRRRRC